MEELLPIVAAAILKMVGNSAQSAQNRADFRFTHNMTNFPAQVQEMKDAGLNPALAYGQISAPQGQSLGNYQSDFLEGLKDLNSSKEARANAEYRDAETDVLKAQAQYIVQKTKNEAIMSDFDLLHQPDRYGLEIQSKGLVNAGLDLKNQGYQIENHGKIIDNEIKTIQRDISEFDRSMKKYDAKKHKDYVDSELKRISSNIALTIAEANSLNQKLPYELDLMYQKMLEINSETNENDKNARKIELENQVEEYMRKNGMHDYVLTKADIQNMVGKLLYQIDYLLPGSKY